MRRALLVGGLLMLAGLAGCATVTKTVDENHAAIRQGWELESREMADDTNMVLMIDRPSRLSRWHVR